MNLMKRAVLAAALVMVPATARAQVDSALAVSHNGVSLFKVYVDGAITAYSTSTPLLRLRSGSPAGDRFRIDSAGGLVALGSLGIGTVPQTGAGVRMMWYPFRAVFRTGGVDGTHWDDASLGFYNAAFGYNSNAKGNFSFAAGHTANEKLPFALEL